jgi:myotubularin-related protein 6/7/8
LDPYYRTFNGLRILVHKEWNYYCHNFLGKNQTLEQKPIPGQRNNPSQGSQWTDTVGAFFGTNNPSSQQQTSIFAYKEWKISPFFLLFLDAVSQLVKLNPVDFEFNPRYLAYLASHIYSNKYYEFVQGDDPT